MRTVVYWMTIVGAPPAARGVRRGHGVHRHEQRPARADQLNVKDDPEYAAANVAVGFSVADTGTGPNRKPMSCAVLAPRASASRVAARAYRVYGAVDQDQRVDAPQQHGCPRGRS